ncbi:MAG TPA: DUF4124 domain-containing protein [Xanthomonadaceae bacterium]|jgi:hypothetical protein|nr:DUF4124 domain-containing protein [Xanthomonadaceae bacterium]
MPPLVCEALLGAFLVGALAVPRAAHADTVTIYRCVDTKGGVSLQDKACPKDARQETREMVRPQDALPQPVAAASHAPPHPVEVRVVHERDPQPAYQCTTPDGDTYINHTGIPQGRYEPLWTTGPARDTGFVAGGHAPLTHAHGYGVPAMSYVEDTCVRLPQEDVCAGLRARADQLGTMIFNAQPSDRERYERERKGLDEQMRSDCADD